MLLATRYIVVFEDGQSTLGEQQESDGIDQ